MTNAKTWGGHRQGAGRKPAIRDGRTRSTPVTLRLTEEEAGDLRAKAAIRGISLGTLVLLELHKARAFGRRSRPTIARDVAEGA